MPPHDVTFKELREAERLIEGNDQVIYKVAAAYRQVVGEVKDMPWFKVAVAKWLVENEHA